MLALIKLKAMASNQGFECAKIESILQDESLKEIFTYLFQLVISVCSSLRSKIFKTWPFSNKREWLQIKVLNVQKLKAYFKMKAFK